MSKVMFLGESVRNKGGNSADRYIPRVISFELRHVTRSPADGEDSPTPMVGVSLPFGSSLWTEDCGQSDTEVLAMAATSLSARGWRDTHAEAQADADAQAADRKAGKLKLG